jgi:hypothetical protein
MTINYGRLATVAPPAQLRLLPIINSQKRLVMTSATDAVDGSFTGTQMPNFDVD